MSVSEKWIEALLPEPVFVGRVRLHPLLCGHVLLLSRLTGWEPLGNEYPPEDIPAGLFVCSRSWREAWLGVGTWRARRFLRKMAREVDVKEVGKAWQDYLERALVLPEFRRVNRAQQRGLNSPPPHQVGAPFLLRLRLFALSELGLGEDGFADMGLADLVWLWLARAEDLGEVKLSDDREKSFVEWAKGQDALRMNLPKEAE